MPLYSSLQKSCSPKHNKTFILLIFTNTMFLLTVLLHVFLLAVTIIFPSSNNGVRGGGSWGQWEAVHASATNLATVRWATA